MATKTRENGESKGTAATPKKRNTGRGKPTPRKDRPTASLEGANVPEPPDAVGKYHLISQNQVMSWEAI
jgi:hypothetical protein